MSMGELLILTVLVAPPFAYLLTAAISHAYFSARVSYNGKMMAQMWVNDDEGDEDGKSDRS